MTAIENTYIVTKDNFEDIAEKLTYANVTANNYNSECFGMSDLILADKMNYVLSEFIDLVIEAGYCPYASLNEILKKHEMFIKEESKRPDLKQQIDESLSIDMGEFKQLVDYSESIYKLYNKD